MPPTRVPVQHPTLVRERDAWSLGRWLVGVDEAGRGPIAGPVVATAVVFPVDAEMIPGVRDSKTLPAARREELALAIRTRVVAIGVAAASCRTIDRVNIRVATAIAMRRALMRCLAWCRTHDAARPTSILLDGLPLPEVGLPHQALVDGDALCYSISAAGIIAKTVRDELMRRLAVRHPHYGWATNMGYGTPEHLLALRAHGATAHHRATFAPVAQLDVF